MAETKEVVAKTQNAVATAVDAAAWGETGVTVGQDILLAKILPMQPTSDLVGSMKAQIGEFRDSLSGGKLGSIAEPFDILPFHIEKFWDELEANEEDEFQWVRTIPLIEDPAKAGYNDNLPWRETVELDGKKTEVKRIRRMNFYVMLPSEIAAGQSVPYILSFKSTSFREGKKVLNQMYLRNKRANLPPPAFLFKLGGLKQKNEKGTFIVPTVELGRRATNEEIQECLNWYQMVRKGKVQVDESDVQQAKDVSMMTDGDMSGTGAF